MQKNFADFRNVLEEENYFESLSDGINKVLTDTSGGSFDGNDLGTVIGLISSLMTTEVLARYHQWLTDNGMLKDSSE
ncbi:hypothetical protein [Faecalibaculum rodentium]|uniref:hypothetical protein n=1 Tax=Faecalibaculum rodentium TaxID=1702221 RepID=UPI002730C0DC|nr:hypothetical protein [Faecalibaculum rodentium]